MKKTTWFLGFAAVVAVVGGGCAAEGTTGVTGAESVVIEPIANELAPASFDRELPGAADPAAIDPGPALGSSAVIEGAAAALTALPACTIAVPSAATMATAQPLGPCVRGSLDAADSGQHFVFSPEPGVSYVIALSRPGDARFDLGVVATAADGTPVCNPLSADLVATRVMVDGTAGSLCAVVHSASGAAQRFTITLAP